jgi:hypothetical protein
MSCRIDRVVSAESLVVSSVSGRITREHVDTLRGVLEEESGGFAHGTELRNCPPYIREWVTRERAETQGRRSEQGLERSEEIEDA